MSVCAPIAFPACVSSPFSLWTCHNTPPFPAKRFLTYERRCQRRASSALVAATAVRTFGMIDVLGPVPSGSREGRVPSECITFRIVSLKEMEAAVGVSYQLEVFAVGASGQKI